MEKAEIKEILRKASVEVDIQGHGKVLCLFESDFDNVAMKLVNKNDDLHSVGSSFGGYCSKETLEGKRCNEICDKKQCGW